MDSSSAIKPLPDLRTHADDWTGVTLRHERKRRQNRLNQRAWHQRRIYSHFSR
ncbi:hypothetical protein LB506_009951 [Fusarium annulatum]|nr:hypothetical protein LB506_009951 [Fusarium annulatum]